MSDLDIGVLNSNQNYSGLVDSSDPFDLYKFSLNSPGKVGVSLSALTANADLEVLDNRGGVLYNASASDLSDEVIAIDNLATGNYTIRVKQVSGEANYNLNLTVENIQVDPLTGLNIESGYFTVGETGQIGVDFINDGGWYKGELAIFSLDGMDRFVPGSEEFIKEAAHRALSNSNSGYVVISDPNEAAKFNVGLANADNDGEYKDVKTFAMKPGDTFGVMLVPNGKVQEVWDNPNIAGNKRPLFSLVTANPNEAFHIGQIADINGTGSAFAIEDQRVDTGTDKDYNDVIFKLTGATGKAVNLDDVINPENDWRDSNLGKDLIDYVKAESPVDPTPPIDPTPVDPTPVDPTPIDPTPIDPTPIDPTPVDPTPVDPTPVDPTPVDPIPVDPTPIDPTPVDPIPVDPTPVDPTPIYNAGNTLATARDLGTLRVNASEIGYSLGVRDFVNNVDEYDYYRFNFEDTNNFNLRLDDLSADAKVELIQDVNNNNLVDEGEVLEISDGGTASQLINRTPLNKGIYYVRVSPGEAGETNYSLSLTASSPELSIAPNQPLIGIIDTGFSGNNADLDYRRFKLGSDRISNDNDPLLSPGEGNEHGTHILGLIAATQGNGIGIDGINDKAPIWLGRAVGSGNWAESLIEFVDAAKQSGQKNAVVNLSLDLTQVNPDGSVTTRYELTPKEREAIEFARQNHVLIVTAAGNDGGVMSVLGQASQEFDNIITVGASNEFDRANYSSYGAGLDIVTEGGNTDNPVLSTVKDGVGMMAGTSVAAARATGVASLVWAANPDLSYRQVIDILELTAVDVKTPGWDAETGAGLLNAVSAIELAKNTTPQTYTPFPWVAPFTWDGEGKVTPSDRAASGGNTLATAAVQPDPNFSDSDIVDVNNREKYYEVTIEQPGYLRYTVTRTNGTEWLPTVELLRTDGKPTSRQFSSSYSKLYNVGAGSPNGGGYVGGAYIAPVSNTEEMFVDPGTYYFKIDLEDSQNNFLDPFGDEPIVYHTNLQNYNLTSEFIPDRPSSFSGAAQFKTPSGVTVAELNTSDQLNYNPTNSTQPGVNYWLDVNEPGNLSLKISSSIADRIQLQVKKLVGLEGENGAGEILVDTGFVALDLSQPIELKNLNKGRYILEVLPRPSWDNINRQWIQQPYTQPFTINGVFSRQAPNPGEGQVPSYAGGFSKTVTSNGVDTHYYANGYLSVQPSGYATWYTYGAGVPLPTIPGATVPGASVPPFSTLGLGTATPVATVPPDYAGNSFNQARNIGVLNSTQTFQDFLGDADPSDYYRFELNNDSNLNWRVDGLTPGVDFQLYNNNFELQWSTNTPAPNFSSDMAGTYPGNPGTYYIRLKPFASGGSNYNFSLSAIPRNTAPENLQFNLTSNSYSVGETVDLNGKVFDRNGANDVSRVDFWLKQNGNDWQFFSRNQSLNRDAQWANFSLSVDGLATGNYELQAIAYDQSGAASNTFTGAFQVTAPFDNNATQWFSNGKMLSGDMLAEYNRLVSQGNYLGNPSFVDTSPAKSYFGTDVQRAFFPSQNLGYTSIYKSQKGTFSLSGPIADYYTNYYFRKYDDPSGKNPYLPDGLFGIYSGLGVPNSSVIKQADGSEVAYFEGGKLTNWNGVVTPTYSQKDRFDLVGQNAPSGTELQWKNDYGYWNPGSVGQPTGPVSRINNGWIQEFTASPKGDGDSIFLLKDGQSALGGLEKYIDYNGQQQEITSGGPYRVQGGILNAYRSLGGQDGVLGFPTMSQERSNFNGYKVYQEFENGFIAETYDGRSIKRNWQGQDIQPEISANHWNARFINRNQWNVADYSTYDYDFKNNPAAVVDLGYQKNSNDSISLNKDFGEGSPATGVQNDNFAMLAWTRIDLKAGKTYKITTQSDDGTWFMLKKAETNNWITNLAQGNDGGDWRDRSATEPAKTIEFKVNESGAYDFHVQYYDRTGFSTINVNLEEIQPFPTNPQPQTSIWSEKVNGVLDGLNGKFQITAPKGGYAGECVSFVKRFTQSLGINMESMGGNGGARYGFINFDKPNLSLSSTQADKIVFTGNEQPQVGDIIFFDQTGSNPYGHVAVVQSVLGDGKVIIEESNANGKAPNTYVTRGEINLNANPPRRGLGAVMGWLRLKNSESASSGSGSSGGGFVSGGGDPGSFPGSSGTTAFPYISITSTSDAADGDTNVTSGGTINIRGKLKNEQTVNFYLGNTQLTTDYITKDGEDFYGSFRIPNSVAPGSYQVKAIVNSSQGFYADALGQLVNLGYSSLWQPTQFAEGGNFNVGIIPFDNLGNNNATQIIRTNATNTWVVSHGFTGSPNDWNINNLAGGLDEIVDGKWPGINTLIGSNDQVLVVDWSQGADRWLIDYGTGASRVDDAGREVANMLLKAGVKPQSVNFVGHSLGAYVSAYAAQSLGEVNTLTLLDPATEFNRPYLGSVETLVNAPRFDRVSKFSTQFGSTTYLGTERTTADESYWVDFEGIETGGNYEHGEVVRWFIDNLRRPNTSPYGTMQSFDMLTNRPRTSKLVDLNMNYNDRNGWEATLISETRTDGWLTSRNEIWKGKVDRSELPGVAYG